MVIKMDNKYQYSSEGEIKKFFSTFMTCNMNEFKHNYLGGYGSVETSEYPLDEWAYYIYKYNADLSVIFDKISEEFYKVDDYDKRFRKVSPAEQSEIITRIVKACCKGDYKKENTILVNRLTAIHVEAAKWKDSTPASKEKMLDMINNDITVLRDVFTKSVLKEIDVEKAFNGVLANNTELLASAAENKYFSQWILRNVWKIYVNEYATVASQQKERETRKRIVDNIRKGLEELG